MKRFVTLLLALTLSLSLAAPALAANELRSFSDVPKTHWAHDDIMRSVELGLVYGTKDPDKNGVGEFSPDATITVAEFVTCVMRVIMNEELTARNNDGQGEYWYSNAVELAVEESILYPGHFGDISVDANMSRPINREEMSSILYGATYYLDIRSKGTIYLSQIKDWDKVTPRYHDQVIKAYNLGLIRGYDNGNFGPQDTLTRGAACSVLNRLVGIKNGEVYGPIPLPTVEFTSTENGVRTPLPVPEDKKYDPADHSTYFGHYINGQIIEPQTWKEGEYHAVPKEGDTIIAKDGTKYTIQATYVQSQGRCILGFGIPCDIWTGTVLPNNFVVSVGNGAGWWGDDGSSMLRNTATGEVHTNVEWHALVNGGLIKRPTTEGTYDGQVSGYYIWRVYQGAFGPEADWSFEQESK